MSTSPLPSAEDLDLAAQDELAKKLTEGCPQCGAVGTERWKRADGVDVCDDCWLEMGPPKIETVPRSRRTYCERRRAIKHSQCLLCGHIYYNRVLEWCLRCRGRCHAYEELTFQMLTRRWVKAPDEAQGDEQRW